mmetsp:Transcript_18891/g.33556  ORF Transcript_18891/g.33556 Transcript_18891/m.33556 type:complete len:135 (+) Transcript_18891:470-874(+)
MGVLRWQNSLSNQANKLALKEIGAVDAAREAMRTHPTHPRIQEWGDRVLEQLEGSVDKLSSHFVATTPQAPNTPLSAATEDAAACVICFETFDDDEHALTVFNCGHAVCETCAYEQRTCHACRRRITRRTKVYM